MKKGLTKGGKCGILCKAFCFTPFERGREMFEKNLEIGFLLDFYGDVLSERKRTVLDYYYNDDLSLAEIGEEIGISRQGVRELIKKAGEELLFYEEKLGLAKRFRTAHKQAEALLSMMERADVSDPIRAAARELMETVGG